MRRLCSLMLILVLLAGCAGPSESVSSSAPPPASSAPTVSAASEPTLSSTPSLPVPASDSTENAIVREAGRVAARLSAEHNSDYEKALAAYDYLLETTYIDLPIGLEAWRWRGGGAQPDYLELHAQSPLLFGIGSCEDYAAALVLLLNEMRIPARYLPGLTISIGGGFVDHAWAVAEIDGVWYHLDPQLEDNVTRNRELRYRYFLKSDQLMLADHRWGDNLVKFGGLTDAQIALVQEQYTPPACPADAAPPEPRTVHKAPKPNKRLILDQLERERAAYEKKHGPLEPLTLDFTPPVFGDEGFGDPRY